MKTKQATAAAILSLILSVASVSAQGVNPATGVPGGPGFNPATGQAINPATGMPGGPAFDSTTGMPIVRQPEWKDANWKDPDIVLADVNFEGLPISEIVNFIRERFKGEFDIILPAPSGGQGAVSSINWMPVPLTDWKSETILQLHLKNVTASELFNAMNLVFENDKTPLRWELKINGHRQIALLRVLINQNPSAAVVPELAMRRIYFVGDLIGDEKSGGMSVEQVIKTITDVWQMTDITGGKIQFHKEAQLLVVSGDAAQVDFMEETLKALRQKVDMARHSKLAAAKSRPDEPAK